MRKLVDNQFMHHIYLSMSNWLLATHAQNFITALLLKLTLIFLFVFSPFLRADTQAGFELFLSPHSNPTWAGTMVDCATHSTVFPFASDCMGAGERDPNTEPNTKFLTHQLSSLWESPEMVVVNVDGVDRAFYHMIVGDLADGFIQESYIEMGVGTPSAAMNAHSGILDGVLAGTLGDYNWNSASGGAYDNISTSSGELAVTGQVGNGEGVFEADAGNATGNPTRAIILQVNSDGEMFSEFLKDNLLTKPKVYQRIFRFGDVMTEFEMDMRHINYGDSSTAGDILINKVEILDSTMIGDHDFDVVTEFQVGKSNITGGKYIYTDGAGPGGSEGEYTYDTGDYDETNVDWKSLFDEFDATGNPWSYEDMKPQ